MRKRYATTAIVLFALVCIVLLLIKNRPHKVIQAEVSQPSSAETNQTGPTALPADVPLQLTIIQQPPRNASEAQKHAWWKALEKKDPYFDYKMPISFYGRVADDEGGPVVGASIEFTWTDLSSAGATQRSTMSGENGMFSLSGVTGQALVVEVGKTGYKRYGSNRSRFEYAYGGPNYYEPDPMNPVVFVLRKDQKGVTH